MKVSRALRTVVRWGPVERAIGRLGALYIALVFRTSRWTYIGFEERERLAQGGERFLIALWHNRLAMMPYGYDRRRWRLTVLTSAHRDGRLVRGQFERFGIGSIGVRSGDADLHAARDISRAIAAGSFIGVTPDGPRGPRMRMKPTIVPLARLCGGRVTLMAYSVKRRIVWGSWDRFIIPLPFNEGVFIWSAGLTLPGKLAREERQAWCDKLERALTHLTDEADVRMGHPAIEPAPADEPPRGNKARRRAQAQAAV